MRNLIIALLALAAVAIPVAVAVSDSDDEFDVERVELTIGTYYQDVFGMVTKPTCTGGTNVGYSVYWASGLGGSTDPQTEFVNGIRIWGAGQGVYRIAGAAMRADTNYIRVQAGCSGGTGNMKWLEIVGVGDESSVPAHVRDHFDYYHFDPPHPTHAAEIDNLEATVQSQGTAIAVRDVAATQTARSLLTVTVEIERNATAAANDINHAIASVNRQFWIVVADLTAIAGGE